MSTHPSTFSQDSPRFIKNPTDYFETPPEFVQAALGLLPEWANPNFILDPAAGNGVWGEGVKNRWEDAHITGVEIDPDMPVHRAYNEWHRADYLTWDTWIKFDLVVTNPPYSSPSNRHLAADFVERALDMTMNFGHVMMLLKTEFVSSQGRAFGLFKQRPPKAIYQSARRIPLNKARYGNRTNTIEYCVMLWEKCSKHRTEFHWFDWLGGELKVW